jgi:DNA-binding transcriptional MerR regulator
MRDMKQVNKLTNAYISEKSGVSLKTIERIMALNSEQDIMRDTARRLESVIIGSERAYPCYLAFQEENMPGHQQLNDVRQELEHALVENSGYKTALENIHASYKSELETVRAEAQEKIDYLKDLVAKLRADNDNLWKENIRKSKIVDMFLERQNTGS